MSRSILSEGGAPDRVRRANLPSLTSLRFVAAAMVFLYHSTRPELTPFTGDTASQLNTIFANAGAVGVGFFFVLSGFVLTWSMKQGEPARQFWRRRAVKIYPNHVVTFVAAMLIFAAATTTWQQWLPNLLLLQSWIPDLPTFFSVNIPSWSLSCEILFYLLFPLLYWAAMRIRAERLWAWACGLAAVVIAVPVFAYTVLPDSPSMFPGYPVSVHQFWFVYLLPPVRALEFAIGILMARIVMSGRWINLRLVPAALLVFVGYVVSLKVPVLYGLSASTVIPIALLIPAVAMADIEGRRSILRNRAVLWLGNVSFAFYLVHALVIMTSPRLFGAGWISDTPKALGLVMLCGAVSLILAGLLYSCVERPMMRHFSRSRRVPAVFPVSAGKA